MVLSCSSFWKQYNSYDRTRILKQRDISPTCLQFLQLVIHNSWQVPHYIILQYQWLFILSFSAAAVAAAMFALTGIIPCSSSLFHPDLKFKHRSSRWHASIADSEESQFESNQNNAREALRKLDQQLESLSQQDTLPRRRPPPSAPDRRRIENG
ncbi:hypothetical protein DsansV1_C04g0040671 [Dioscorea sansibarensis]